MIKIAEYLTWQTSRLRFIQSLFKDKDKKEFFNGKTVLELTSTPVAQYTVSLDRSAIRDSSNLDRSAIRDSSNLEVKSGSRSVLEKIEIQTALSDEFRKEPKKVDVIITYGIVYKVTELVKLLETCLANCDYFFVDGFFADVEEEWCDESKTDSGEIVSSLVTPAYFEKLLNQAGVYFQKYDLHSSNTTPPHPSIRLIRNAKGTDIRRYLWAVSTKLRQKAIKESVIEDAGRKEMDETKEFMDRLDIMSEDAEFSKCNKEEREWMEKELKEEVDKQRLVEELAETERQAVEVKRIETERKVAEELEAKRRAEARIAEELIERVVEELIERVAEELEAKRVAEELVETERRVAEELVETERRVAEENAVHVQRLSKELHELRLSLTRHRWVCALLLFLIFAYQLRYLKLDTFISK
jgi:chemotaxis protein histidine kinase CheA